MSHTDLIIPDEYLSDDENQNSQEFGVTAITRLKHADLWAAAKKLGSQSALARHLGIPPNELCR